MKTLVKRLAITLAGAGLFAFAFAPINAKAATLAEILTSDGNDFDANQNDFDIVTQAVLAFPDLTAAAANTEGQLTVFLPTDKAFRILIEDLFGMSIKDEEELFNEIVDKLGLENVKKVLLYHIVEGVVSSSDVVSAGDGAQVPTLLGQSLTLDFKGRGQIRLMDAAPLRDPIIRQVDIFATNGVAHVIDRVLIPSLD